MNGCLLFEILVVTYSQFLEVVLLPLSNIAWPNCPPICVTLNCIWSKVLTRLTAFVITHHRWFNHFSFVLPGADALFVSDGFLIEGRLLIELKALIFHIS